MDVILVLQLSMLLVVANGAPVLAKRLFGKASARPVDGGAAFLDGRPLFGAAKTWRGITVSILATSVCAPLVGLPLWVGAAIGAGAMAGDLLSSFVKRRMARPVSSRALALDQVPEALVPLLLLREALALGLAEIAVAVAIFFIGSLGLSRLMFDLKVREQPF
jgi:CDP-2,3-bis-(O-geranylgeranyl)-sn-glycerol synthase